MLNVVKIISFPLNELTYWHYCKPKQDNYFGKCNKEFFSQGPLSAFRNNHF